jgi:hypothetical protein
MNRTIQLQDLDLKLARGGMRHKDEKRTKIVRLRESTFSELRKLGEMGNDTDDIVSMLLEFWEKHHKERK